MAFLHGQRHDKINKTVQRKDVGMDPIETVLEKGGYLASRELANMVSIALTIKRPLLIEGPPGSGKTFMAEALARALHRNFIRLSCYEGMDASQALYDWNYHKQLAEMGRHSDIEPFSEKFLLERPLLKALTHPDSLLLIDEIDRADEPFEALLLEYLADYQISIPEWKTVKATAPPITILTSNRTRRLSDALKRRTLYAYLDWPDRAREIAIIHHSIPELDVEVLERLVDLVRCLRKWDLVRAPGLTETLDWARAQESFGTPGVDRAWVRLSLGCVIKDAIDYEVVLGRMDELLDKG